MLAAAPPSKPTIIYINNELLDGLMSSMMETLRDQYPVGTIIITLKELPFRSRTSQKSTNADKSRTLQRISVSENATACNWDGFKNSAPKMYSFFVYQVKEGTGSDGSEPGESSSEDESGSVNGADEDGRKKFTPLVWSATGLFLLDQEPTVGGGVAGAHGRPRS